MENDCSTPQVNEARDGYRYDQKTDKSLTVLKNSIEGWEKEICYKCANKDESVNVVFTAKQIFRCNARLTKKTLVMNNDDAVVRYQDSNIWHDYIHDTADYFFINDNHDSFCPVTTCRLMKPGCSEEEVSTNVRVYQSKGDKNWRLQTMLNQPYGYIEHLCVQCTNGGDGFARQTINWDNFRIQLPSVCTHSMEINPSAPKDMIVYSHDDAESGNQVYSDGFKKFFVNNEKKLCPITSCKLLKAGCATAWDGGDGNNIEMAATAPWAITIKDNTFAGYGADEMCV